MSRRRGGILCLKRAALHTLVRDRTGEMSVTPQRLSEIADLLRREYRAQRVILFGSVARGEAGPDSDIDLFVTAPTEERFYDRLASVRRLLRPLTDGLPVAPIVLTPAEVEARLCRGDQFIGEILATGVDL